MAEVTGVTIRKFDKKFMVTAFNGEKIVVEKAIVDHLDVNAPITFTREGGAPISIADCKGTLDIYEDLDGKRVGTLVCRE